MLSHSTFPTMDGSSPRHTPKRILVTGGAGFIGSNFLLRMVPGYPDAHFINLDKLGYAGNLANLQDIEEADNYTFVHGDVADRSLVRELFDQHDFTTVVHFAAESHVDRSIMEPLSFVESNTVGTVNLLETARQSWLANNGKAGIRRFHHVSTDEVFGTLGDQGAFNEETPYDPRSPYSASKAASDHFVRAYGHTYGLPYTISNCSNNYGPYQFPEKLIPLAISRAIGGEAIPIYGRGQHVRDWLHVHDHCDAIDRILRRGETGKTYLISGREERTNLDLIKHLMDLVDEALERPRGTSRKLITFVKDRPGHDYRYAIDASRLTKELDWRPSFDLTTGLRQTIAWYLDHKDWLEAVMDDSYRDYYEQQYVTR